MVPVPEVANWEALDQLLLAGSRQDEQRWIGDRSQSVGAGMTVEREHLRALAEEGFDLAGVHFPKVNASSCVRVLTNFYSSTTSGGSGGAGQGVLLIRGDLAPRTVCGEARTLFRATAEDPELGALPGRAAEEARALAGSTPLEQWRAQGRWPASFDRFWEMSSNAEENKVEPEP